MPALALARRVVLAAALVAAAACYSSSTYKNVDLGGSALWVPDNNVAAGGSTAVQVLVRRGDGRPLAGLQVALQADQCAVTPALVTVDATGAASASIGGCEVGQHTVAGQVVYGDLRAALPTTASVNFYAAAASGGLLAGSNVNGSFAALDAAGSLDVGFAGTVHFVSSDPLATLPADYTYGPADHGVAVVIGGITLRTPGTQTVSAIVVGSGVVLATQTYQVAAPPQGPLFVAWVGLPGSAVAGAVQAAQLQVRDAAGAPSKTFVGTVTVQSGDPQAVLPAPVAFAAGDGGQRQVALQFGTAGPQQVTAAAPGAQAATATVRVQAGPPQRLQLASLSSATAGNVAVAEVAAVDAFGNIAAGYNGSLRLSSSDSRATLPGDTPFSPGSGGTMVVAVTFVQAGPQSLTVADVGGQLVPGQLAAVAVHNAAAKQLTLTTPAASVAGAPNAAAFTALDAYGNLCVDYTGTVQLLGSDPNAVLSPPQALVAGSGAGTVAWRTAGNQALTAHDAAGVLADAMAAVRVSAAPPVGFRLDLTAPAPALQARPLRLSAVDAYGNVQPNYLGTVHLSSSDPNATLPADATFAAADQGSRLLPGGITFATAGPQSVTATDAAAQVQSVRSGIAVYAARFIGGHLAFHTCAGFSDGTLRCWGRNSDGQLGYGDTVNRGADPNTLGPALTPVALGSGHTVSAVAAAARNTCALLDGGLVKCWGNNDSGQLGQGDTVARGSAAGQMGDALLPIALGSGRHAVQVAAMPDAACARLDDGTVKCWGAAAHNGYGDGNGRGAQSGQMGDALLPLTLGAGRTAVDLQMGGHLACLIADDATLRCWGDTATSNSGTPAAPMNLGTGRSALQVSVGDLHVCAILDNGGVKCWGYNYNGQLGVGDNSNRSNPDDSVPPVSLGTGRRAVALSTQGYSSCALLDNGAVKCWGFNGQGELGTGDATYYGNGSCCMGDGLPAVALGSGRSAVQISVNYYSACALLDNLQARCWGWNTEGQLGTGDGGSRGNSAGTLGDGWPVVQW